MPKPGVFVLGEGVIVKAIQGKTLSGNKKMVLRVGYSAPYAVYVHEDLEAQHLVGKAKYLSGPARGLAGIMRQMVTKSLQRKQGLRVALTQAGQFLLRESQKLVPVDTGFLRASGFVRVDDV